MRQSRKVRLENRRIRDRRVLGAQKKMIRRFLAYQRRLREYPIIFKHMPSFPEGGEVSKAPSEVIIQERKENNYNFDCVHKDKGCKGKTFAEGAECYNCAHFP